MAKNTPAQQAAVKRYVAQTEQWQVRTKDPKLSKPPMWR